MGSPPSEFPYRGHYEVTDAEAATVGVLPGEAPNVWGERLRPIMIAKGCPEDELWTGNPRLVLYRRERNLSIFRLYFDPGETPSNK